MVPQRQRSGGGPPGGDRPWAVALVGIDGSGKTTQARLLADELNQSGIAARYWRNAGGRHWFGRLAGRLGWGEDGDLILGRHGMLLTESVLRWLAIARALVRSRMTGQVAVMDRYSICQYASIRAHRPHRWRRWERLARAGYRIFPEPDVTFLLAVAPAEAYRRIERRGTDHESLGFLTAADAAYRSLPERGRLVVIDANGGPDEVARAIRRQLTDWLPRTATTPTATTTPTGPVRPDRTPEWWHHWSVPIRRWRRSAPPQRSRPEEPTGSGPPPVALPG